jgi:serine protease AprX
MARPKRPSNSDATWETRAVSISDNLAKTRIGPDLLTSIDAARTKMATKRTSEELPRFDVIIEFNRSFPGGAGTARLTLLSAYEKARHSEGLAAIPVEYRPALAAAMPRDDHQLVEAFGPKDTVAIRKSMWTDNYVFATLSVAAISKLAQWTLAVRGDMNDANKPEKRVPLVYKIWHDHNIVRCVYESTRTIKCDAAITT